MVGSRAAKTVLVVDDSELACEAVTHSLSGTGVKVVALNSPFGFIKAIRESRPCLILLDVGLGSVNGAKLVGLGRRYVPTGCAILLYSGREPKLLQQDVVQSGADGYIAKGTTGAALVAAVERWIGKTGV